MRTLLALLLVAGCGHSPAALPDRPADFAVAYGWSSGSLPPRYHHRHRLEVAADGAGTLLAETAYGDGPSQSWTFSLTDAERDALYAALRDGDAFQAWREDDNPPVGGSSWWAELRAGGAVTEIPGFVRRGQADGKDALADVLRGAVPASVWAEHLNWLASSQASLSEADGG